MTMHRNFLRIEERELEAGGRGTRSEKRLRWGLRIYSTSHQFSEFVSGFKDWAKFLTMSRTAVASGTWNSGSAGMSLAIWASARFKTRACWRASRILSA